MVNPVPVIDLEASGLSENSFPIEVGIYVEEYGQVISESWLIKPVDIWLNDGQWSDAAFNIHRISKDTLIKEGIDGYKVCNILNQLLGDMIIYSDAPDHDQMWLSKLFNYWNIEQLFYLDYILDYEYQYYKKQLFNMSFQEWNESKADVVKEFNLTKHRAKDDALMLNKAFQKIINEG
jgi:DNA polymerase III epsilon subunit-like protein